MNQEIGNTAKLAEHLDPHGRVPSALPAAPARRRRIRFSLATLVLGCALLGACGLLAMVFPEMHALRMENHKLRAEQGKLSVYDPSRIYALKLETYEELTWRWRIYLPNDRRYRLCISTKGLPQVSEATAVEGTISTDGDWSESLLTVAVLKHPDGKWKVALSANGETILVEMHGEFKGFFNRSNVYFSLEKGEPANVRLQLLRAFESKRPNNSDWSMPSRESDEIGSLLVWIEEAK